MNTQIHVVMKKQSSGLERLAWASPETGTLFCGICLRGRVHESVGSTCESCGSEVVGNLESIRGGATRPARIARMVASQRAVSTKRSGNVLIMKAS